MPQLITFDVLSGPFRNIVHSDINPNGFRRCTETYENGWDRYMCDRALGHCGEHVAGDWEEEYDEDMDDYEEIYTVVLAWTGVDD